MHPLAQHVVRNAILSCDPLRQADLACSHVT